MTSPLEALAEERAAARRGARARVLRRVLVAGAFGCAMLGAYLDSIVLIVAGMVAAVPSVVAFARAARPHNHWAEFRRRRPGDP